MNSNLAYQEERRQELIGGQVVMMAPATTNHNRIIGNLNRIFGNYLNGRTCEPFGDGEAVYLTDEDQFIPDFMVVCDPNKVQWDGVHGAPDLVVEVLSPSTARNDRGHKKNMYEKCGVREYWIISPGDKSVEVYRTDGTVFIFHDIYTLHTERELAKLTSEEQAAVVTHFQCSLFNDLDIALDDIFYRTY